MTVEQFARLAAARLRAEARRDPAAAQTLQRAAGLVEALAVR